MTQKPTIGLYGVLEKTEEGWENARAQVDTVEQRLTAAGMQVMKAPDLVADDQSAHKAVNFFSSQKLDLLLAVVITWSFDHLSLRIVRSINRPLGILAIPGIKSGSIVGAHQLSCLLTDLEIERNVFYGALSDDDTYRPIAAYAKAAAAKSGLDQQKLAFIGRRTPGMSPIAFDELEITRLFGAQVVSYGWEEIEAGARTIDKNDVEHEKDIFYEKFGEVLSSTESIEKSLIQYLVLKNIAEKEHIAAFALGCYPHYAGISCLVTGLLSDHGIPAACEGDMNSVLAMYLIQHFTNRPAHFGEILAIDPQDNSIVTSHCGCSAPSLAENPASIDIAPVRIWDRGACFKFTPEGTEAAVFLNLVGRKGNYRLCSVSGRAEKTEMVFEGNPVKMIPNCSIETLMETINEEGFGHHWMMGFDNVSLELKYFVRITGMKGVFL